MRPVVAAVESERFVDGELPHQSPNPTSYWINYAGARRRWEHARPGRKTRVQRALGR
ncbi:hypothetical protein GCM10028775_76510 [Catellatospora paridis]